MPKGNGNGDISSNRDVREIIVVYVNPTWLHDPT